MAADAVPRVPSGLCRRCVRHARAPARPLMNFTYAAILFLVWGTPVNAQKQGDCNPDAPATYTAAVLEYSPALGVTMENARAHFQQNVRNYAAYTKEAKRQGADIVVFPECGLVTLELPHLPDSSPAVAVRLPGNGANPCVDTDMDYPTELRELSCAARDAAIYVVVNLPEEEDCEPALAFCPECPGFDPRAVRSGVVACNTQGKRFFNSDVAFDRSGAVVAKYRKYNLFGEAGFVPPAEPPLAYFDADFGVRFGLFTCFDLMFEQPAVALVAELGISDIVFPTAWFSELPFLTAVQAQASWAWLLDVNMLAAGYNLPEVGSTGTGIYSGRRGKVVATMEKERTNKLLVGRLPNRYACAGGGRGGGRAKGEEAERKRVKIVVLSRKDWDPPPPPPLKAPAAPPCAAQLPRHPDAGHAPSLYSCHLQSLLDKPKDQGVQAGKAGLLSAQWPEWEEREWAIQEEAEGEKKPNKTGWSGTAGWADLVHKIDKTKSEERAEKKVTVEGEQGEEEEEEDEEEDEDEEEEEEEETAVEIRIEKEVKAEEEGYDEEEGAEGVGEEEVDLEEEQRLDEAELLEATAPLDEDQERAFIHGPRYARYIRDVLYPGYKEMRAHGKDKEKEKEPAAKGKEAKGKEAKGKEAKGKEAKEKQAKERQAKEQKPAPKGAEEAPSFDDTVAEMSKNIAKNTGEDAARIEVAQYEVLLEEHEIKDEGEEEKGDGKLDGKPPLDPTLSHAMEGDEDKPSPEEAEDMQDLEELAAEDDRYQEEMETMVHHAPLIDNDLEVEDTTKATPEEDQDITRVTPLHPTLATKVFRAGEDDPFPEMVKGIEANGTTDTMKATTEATTRGRADDKKPADVTTKSPDIAKVGTAEFTFESAQQGKKEAGTKDRDVDKKYLDDERNFANYLKQAKKPTEDEPTSEKETEKDVKVYKVIDDTEEKRIAVDKKIKEKEYEEEKSQKEEKWKSNKYSSEETFKPTSVSDTEEDVKGYQVVDDTEERIAVDKKIKEEEYEEDYVSDTEKDVKVYEVIDDTEERRIAVDKKIKEKEYEEEKSQKEEKWKSSKYSSEETFKPTSVSDTEEDVKGYQVIDDTEERRIAVDKKIKEEEYEEDYVSDTEKDVKVYQVIDDTEERRIAVDKKIKEKDYEEEKSQKEEKWKATKYPEKDKVSEKERIEETKVLIDEKIDVDFESTEQVMQEDVTGVEGQVVDTEEIRKEERKIPKCVKKTKKFTEIKHTLDERDETSAENLQPVSPEASEYEVMISETKEEIEDTMQDKQKKTEDEYLTMRQPASDKFDAEEKEIDYAEDSEKGVVISEKGENIDETKITIDEEVSEYEDKIIEHEEITKRQVKEYMETDEGISEEKEEIQETKIVVDKEIDFDFESFDDVVKGGGEESLDEDVIMRQPMERAEKTLEYSEEVKKEYREEEEMGKEVVEDEECKEEYQARTDEELREEETWRKDDYGMLKQPEEAEKADEDYEDYCAEYDDKEDMEIAKEEKPEVPSMDEIPRAGMLEERPPKCECVRRRTADAAARGSSATDAGEPTPDDAPEASKADTAGAPKPAGGLYRNRLTGRDEGYLYLKTEDLSKYVTILIPAEHPPPAVHENSSLHLCHGTFCCKFQVVMQAVDLAGKRCENCGAPASHSGPSATPRPGGGTWCSREGEDDGTGEGEAEGARALHAKGARHVSHFIRPAGELEDYEDDADLGDDEDDAEDLDLAEMEPFEDEYDDDEELQMDVSAELSIDPVLLKASGIGHWQGGVPDKDDDLTQEDMEPSEEAIRAAQAVPSDDLELKAAFEGHAPQALPEGDEKVEPSTPRPEHRTKPSKEEDIPSPWRIPKPSKPDDEYLAEEETTPFPRAPRHGETRGEPFGWEKAPEWHRVPKPEPQRPCARWAKRRVPREETMRKSDPAQHDEPSMPAHSSAAHGSAAHGTAAHAPGEDTAAPAQDSAAADDNAPRRYYYRAVVFNGRRTFDGVTEGGLQVCAVIPCTSTNVESCGKLHPGDVDMEQVVFRHVRISGRFTRVRSLPLPSTLDTHLMPLPSDTFTLKATLRTYESNIVMETHKPLSFLTFGIYNRNFANDPDRQPTIG